MKKALRLAGLMCLWCARMPADPAVVELWPGGAAGSEKATGEEVWAERGQQGLVDRSVANVHKPTLTVYLPLREKATRAAVIICPGGGYVHLAIDKEGHDVAKWLNSIGVAGFVLKYRLSRTKGHDYTMETSLLDARRAVEIVRARATEWGVDPKKVGMMGFSAGGDLAAQAGMRFDAASRPDFLALLYPAIPKELAVTGQTPPSFLVHADDDRLTSENSVRFYLALKRAAVAAELHVYAKGGHGFGIRNRGIPVSAWILRFEEWLAQLRPRS
jgi:endo-1,4-beta-xylanase